MNYTYPYVSTNYVSGQYRPQSLTIVSQKINQVQPPHFSDEAEYLIVTAGEATLMLNNQPISLSAGEVVLLMPFQLQQLKPEPDNPIELFRVRLSLGLVLLSSIDEAQYTKALQNSNRFHPIIRIKQTEQDFLIHFCQETIRQKQLPTGRTSSLNLALVSYLFHLFQTETQVPLPDQNPDTAWQWLRYLQYHHQSAVTLTELATIFGKTEHDIQQGLVRISGFTFNQLLNQVRIRNATALLQFSELTIRQIANICGFKSIGTFYYQFELVHRQRPLDYRKQLRTHDQLVGLSDGWVIGVYLLEHCYEPITVEQLAQQLNFSVDTVTDRLKQHFGLTFKPLLNLFRCELARPLVLASTLTIDQIAIKAGYHDTASFVRNYRQIWQVTPSQERREQSQRP